MEAFLETIHRDRATNKAREKRQNSEEFRQKLREASLRWHYANRERAIAALRLRNKNMTLSEEQKVANLERQKKYRAADPEHFREKNRRWYSAKGRDYYMANRDKLNQRTKDYYWANRDKISKRVRERRAAAKLKTEQ